METNRTTSDFVINHGLRPEHRAPAARGYWRAFATKLRYPLGPEAKAVAFIEGVLDPDYAISALSDTGAFLGVAGFRSHSGSFIGGDIKDLAAVYGWVGGTLRGVLVSVLERKVEDGTLLMDGIFVEPEARGRGVGTALLHAIEDHAVSAKLQRIRLDVIDINPRARSLYEREGFRERSVMSLGILSRIFGFSHATEMTKRI
ncbi:GNAT family N-acetyltransferase [Hoeflea poritis]|uniref:GNAT family N-acetyltransferase n=1 Tax=Hoeflea poritis TaxID=2993659 RepID=A0ABT4VUZ7_9HYPH|nr:GNAT family N-acetyltransferase [Hoeflea poritis]MDA4848553.1 GNAT family N-acetyltransferase [Hoeflea poritis]